MMKHFIRTIALSLCAVICAAALASCGGEDKNKETSAADTTAVAETTMAETTVAG